MRVRRGGQWEKVRQSPKEREKELLRKSGVSDLEIDRRTVEGEGGEQDGAAATTGVQQRSLEHSAGAAEGRAAKRKPFYSPSGPQTKAKYSSVSVGTNTRSSVNETFSMIEEVVALNPQSNVLEDSAGRVRFVPWESCQAKAATPGVRFRMPGHGWRCLSTAPMRGCEPNSPSVSNVLLNQPGRASLPKVVHPAKSVSEKEQDHEAAFIPVHDTEEINSEVIWELIQKLHGDKRLVMENKRLKDGLIVLLQLVKDQKQMIDELSKQNRAEVDCFKEKTAQLIKDKEELQQRLSRANEIVKLLTDVLGAKEASKDGMNDRG